MKLFFTLFTALFFASLLSAQTVNLSTYVRVGRYDLPEPTRTIAPANSLLAQEVSAVTYNWDTQSLFVVGDGGTSIVQVTKTGQLINSMTLAPGTSPQGTDFYDPEGLTYIGNGKFVMSEERDRQLVLFTYVAGTTLTRSNAQTVKLGTFVQNIGIEGLSFDPLTSGYICVKETQPQGIFQTGVDFAAGTATNGSPTTENSVNLFDPALAGLLDFADVFALSNLPSLSGNPQFNNLLVLSQESGKIVNIDRSGNISSSLTIVSDAGNPLTVAAQQHEGLTMDRDGFLYVVSENGGGDFDHPQLWVYAPSAAANQAPTAVGLTNAISSILENSSTTSSIKVADITVTDDGQGTNNLSLSGADAGFFEITGTGLFIKAGTVLDYETKTTYNISITVDDPSVGSTPDATVNYTLNVTDVLVENPSAGSLIISEVSPWSSGNSPVGADWFEVTNTGTAAVNIAGWKMDDNSNSFATSVALNGISSIAPGESVIFLETANLATTAASFRSTWFGANPPAGLQIGNYTGSGVGLSTGGDAVNLFNGSGTLQAKITFGASPAGPFPTFNNAAGLNNTTISQLSAVGINGAFAAINDAAEIGSPGTVGRLIISEVAPWSSGNSPVGADWFEVTNTKAVAADITGWKIDDASGSPVAAVALNGITSIAPGESVIFIETATPNTTIPFFKNTWFGSNPPAAIKIGSYTGGGVGLGTGGDAVNVYNSAGVLQASVLFSTSPAGPIFSTFDNAAALNNTTISQLSATGVYGAFVAKGDANEIGSPGRINNPVCLSTTSLTSVSACNNYSWNGTSYTSSGTYNYSTFNAAGCDSTATLNLSINSSTSSTTNITAVNSYVFNGVTYTTSGTYTATGFINAVGCDSSAVLILVINRVNVPPGVSILSPSTPVIFNAGDSISAQVLANDTDGQIAKVDLFVNGGLYATDSVSPFTFYSTNVEPGIYKVFARATDDSGAVAETDTLFITVNGCSGSGSITGEGFTDIPGANVSDLIVSSAFLSGSPTITASLNSFEYANVTDNYGARVRGYICAPVTGNYVFSIAADDQAGLYLSTDADPAKKVLIAYTASASGFRVWNRFSTQQSAAIPLVKGGRYYIETLHKDAVGQDYLSVGWRIPGGSFEGPLPGIRLSPYMQPLPTGGRVAGARAFAAAMTNATTAGAFKITAAPNPSNNYFNVAVKSNSNKEVSVKILDAAGRLLETRLNVAANTTIQIGNSLRPGVYFVELQQGIQTQRLKLVKQ